MKYVKTQGLWITSSMTQILIITTETECNDVSVSLVKNIPTNMKIIKAEEEWYRAEQKISNGILSYEVKAYGTTHAEAIKELITREYKN